LGIVTVIGSTFIRKGFSVGSSMILEIEASVNRLENFFSKHFYRISVPTLLLVPEVLEWDHFEEYVLQKGNQQVEGL